MRRKRRSASPAGFELRGVNLFQFVDGYSIHVHVFKARDFEGEPNETDEAAPLWAPVDRIPYEEMWEDDRLWIPLVLEGVSFSGRYVFDGDRMLDHVLDLDSRKVSVDLRRIPRPPTLSVRRR
jgi:8-oxo-dGTP diphosphatase